MGEIYRSALVTGTRKLETERVVRARHPTRQKKPATEPGHSPTAATSEKDFPGERDAGEELPLSTSQESVSKVDTTALSQDLVLAQQRRIDQLESVVSELEATLAVAVESLEQANAGIEEKVSGMKEQGYRDGLEQAQDAVVEQRKKLESEFLQARTVFTGAFQSQLEKVNHYALEIAFAALTRLIGKHHSQAGFGRAVIEEALIAVQGAGKVAVHISAQDFELLRGIESELADVSRVTEIELIPDPRVSVGGCLIETEMGVWDARLETQLQRLKDSIEQAMSKA